MPSNYKRHELNLFDASDETKNFQVSHNNGVVTFSVPGGQHMTVSGKATFTGTDTCVVREDGGVSSTHSLESLFDGLDSSVATLNADLATEVARATAAEGVLDARITSEVATINTTESNNHAAAMAAVAAEQVRAQQAEGVLTADLATEVARATAAETAINNSIAALQASTNSSVATLTQAIADEEARALAAEGVIQADVDANEAAAAAARTAMQNTLQGNIDGVAADLATETGRATAAEAGLQGQIDNIVSNADPAALDSLSEIVAHFNAADSEASNLLALLIARVKCIEDVMNALTDPDLPAMDQLLLDELNGGN